MHILNHRASQKTVDPSAEKIAGLLRAGESTVVDMANVNANRKPAIAFTKAITTNRLPPGMRREFRSYLNAAGLDRPELVESDAAEAMTAPYLWLIRRIGHDGITLTAAGWLPPAVVQQAMTAAVWFCETA